jgi:chromosome segregation ATPase
MSTSIAEQLAALSHEQASARLKQLSQDVKDDEAEYQRLSHACRVAAAEVQTIEEQLAISPDSPELQEQLRAAQDALATAKERLRQHPAQARARKAALAAVGNELGERERLLRKQVWAECAKKWQGTSETHTTAARRVLAAAVVSYAYKHGMEPDHVDVQRLIDAFISPFEVSNLAKEIVKQERAEMKAELVSKSGGRHA